ncbi:ferrochelatase, partial [Rhizobiaceae sp. 2RAB30]
ILLVNLGTPDGTDFGSMWRYLREFLSDPRVIELNKVIWYPILYGLVLTTRPSKSGANYAKIWNRERDESPLRTYTRAQTEKLAAIFADRADIVVDYGMRYGNPSIASAVTKLKAAGCDRILTFPLYPQYSATTTATANDKLFRALMTMRDAPAVRSVPPYYNEPVYIDALARSVEKHLAAIDFEPEIVIASYHGIPKPYSDKGDPYRQHCLETTRLLRERLGWNENKLITCFQSRFGAQEWLQPYADKTVERLGKEGVKSIAVINPGFSVDC